MTRESLKNPYAVRGRQREQKDELLGMFQVSKRPKEQGRTPKKESTREKTPGKNGENGSRTAGKKTPTE